MILGCNPPPYFIAIVYGVQKKSHSRKALFTSFPSKHTLVKGGIE